MAFDRFILLSHFKVFRMSTFTLTHYQTHDDDFCYKRVQTPGMSLPRAGAWTYCLFTPSDAFLVSVFLSWVITDNKREP